MNCRQSELQRDRERWRGKLNYFPSWNPITSFPGNFQSRAKCCQTEKSRFVCRCCCHVSMQRGKLVGGGENSKGKLELICVLHNFPCHKNGGVARRAEEGNHQVANYLPYHVQIKNVKCFNFCLSLSLLCVFVIASQQRQQQWAVVPLRVRYCGSPPLGCQFLGASEPPLCRSPSIGLCKFICGDFALAPN